MVLDLLEPQTVIVFQTRGFGLNAILRVIAVLDIPVQVVVAYGIIALVRCVSVREYLTRIIRTAIRVDIRLVKVTPTMVQELHIGTVVQIQTIQDLVMNKVKPATLTVMPVRLVTRKLKQTAQIL